MPVTFDEPSPQGKSKAPAKPTPFSGGELVFHADRVLLCGVDICSGPKCQSKRVVLELLARVRLDGSFAYYSGRELEAEAARNGATGDPAGCIRDLRADISGRLLAQANIAADPKEVILSGGIGYRLSDRLTVQWDVPTSITVTTDTPDHSNVLGEDPDVRGDVRGLNDSPSAERREWIVRQLEQGRQLRADDVVERFACTKKTALRDLGTLKEAGKIEFVGTTRTGYYRLRKKGR